MDVQYYAPQEPFYVGDCMPFFDQGTFHLYYLLDIDHHQGNNGLGGHQWAHISSTDLKHWKKHSIALPLDPEKEGSICTGSVFKHGKNIYAFYATRNRDWTQHISYAISEDGIRFNKQEPNRFLMAPEGYLAADFRDPYVFKDEEGSFQMLITSRVENFPLADRGGCIMRMSSKDLMNWKCEGTVLVPGGPAGADCVPECPDLFLWNGWYYLLFGTKHQTSYVMSRSVEGPWTKPKGDVLGTAWMLSVMKTATFKNCRRIGAGWIGKRHNNRDSGKMLWGGNLVLREFIQFPDGRLGTKFPKELIPKSLGEIDFKGAKLTGNIRFSGLQAVLLATDFQAVMAIENVPLNFRFRCEMKIGKDTDGIGVGLRGVGNYKDMYALEFDVWRKMIRLEEEQIDFFGDFGQWWTVDIIAKDDIIDVCVQNSHCLINRLGEKRGDKLFISCEKGLLRVKNMRLQRI